MNLLSHKQYVEKSGMICPWCLSDDLDWGHLEAETRGATQEVSCNSCDKQWVDVHELVAFSEV